MAAIDSQLPLDKSAKIIWKDILFSLVKNFIFYGPGLGAIFLISIVHPPALIYVSVLLFFFGVLLPAGKYILGYLKDDSGTVNLYQAPQMTASLLSEVSQIQADPARMQEQRNESTAKQPIMNQSTNAGELTEQELLRIKNEKLIAPFWGIVNRMNTEIQNLAKRGNVNLLIGGAVAMIGISVLVLTIYDAGDIVEKFFPRLSFVIFVELIAFFFLSLYRQCINEVKYYQNEITNVESKTAALQIALVNNDADTVKTIIAQLSLTERNFILAQGQSTVDIERIRLADSGQDKIIDLLKDLIKVGK